jgi:hypothetical protein
VVVDDDTVTTHATERVAPDASVVSTDARRDVGLLMAVGYVIAHVASPPTVTAAGALKSTRSSSGVGNTTTAGAGIRNTHVVVASSAIRNRSSDGDDDAADRVARNRKETVRSSEKNAESARMTPCPDGSDAMDAKSRIDDATGDWKLPPDDAKPDDAKSNGQSTCTTRSAMT